MLVSPATDSALSSAPEQMRRLPNKLRRARRQQSRLRHETKQSVLLSSNYSTWALYDLPMPKGSGQMHASDTRTLMSDLKASDVPLAYGQFYFPTLCSSVRRVPERFKRSECRVKKLRIRNVFCRGIESCHWRESLTKDCGDTALSSTR